MSQANSQPVKKRSLYVDHAKALGILMITYGHITELGNGVDRWMSLFKVSVFFVTAGFVMAMSGSWKRQSMAVLVKKRLISLGIPYVTFSVLAVIVRVGVAILKGSGARKTLRELLFHFFTLRGLFPLWFLPVLFLSELLFLLILKSKSRLLLGLTFLWPILVTVLTSRFIDQRRELLDTLNVGMDITLVLAKAVVAVWFLAVGYMSFFLFGKIKTTPGLAAGLLLLAATIAFSRMTDKIDINMMKLGTIPVLFYAGGVAGSLGSLFIFRFLEEKKLSLPFLTYFGQNSLALMGLQRGPMIINFISKGFAGVAAIEKTPGLKYHAECLCILVLVLLAVYGATEIINRYFPWMLGRFKKKTA